MLSGSINIVRKGFFAHVKEVAGNVEPEKQFITKS